MLFRPLLPGQVLLAEIPPHAADPARLHPDEFRQIERAVPKRRHEFAAGRLLARNLLARAGHPLDALISDNDRVPRWPDAVTGSITHCDTLCAVALTNDPGILGLGIDVEPAVSLNPALLPQVLRASEIARLDDVSPALRPLAGMLAFCAKEAVYKAVYPRRRRFLEFHDVELQWHADDEDPDSGRFEAFIRVDEARVEGRAQVIGRYRRAGSHLATAVVLER